jgi:hypothetical protein
VVGEGAEGRCVAGVVGMEGRQRGVIQA